MRASSLLVRLALVLLAAPIYLLLQAAISGPLLLNFLPFSNPVVPHEAIAHMIVLVGFIFVIMAIMFPHFTRCDASIMILDALALAVAIMVATFAVLDPYRLFIEPQWLGPSTHQYKLNPVIRELSSAMLVIVVLRIIGRPHRQWLNWLRIASPAAIVALALIVPQVLGYPVYRG